MGNSHLTKVKAAPLSLDLSRDDYDMERRVTLFLSSILQLNSCHATVKLFLLDPVGLIVFKKFIRKSVTAEEADMFIEVVKASSDEAYAGDIQSSSIVRCFVAFLKSSQFTSWTAGIRAHITSFVTFRDDLTRGSNKNGSIKSSKLSLSHKDRGLLSRSASGDYKSTFRTMNTVSSDAISLHTADSASSANAEATQPQRETNAAEVYASEILLRYRGKDYSGIVHSQSWIATLSVAAECINVPIAILRVNPTSTGHPMLYSNPALHRFIGYSRSECTHQPGHFMTRLPAELEYCMSASEGPFDPCYNQEDFMQFKAWQESGSDVCVTLQIYSKLGKKNRVVIVTKTIVDESKKNRFIIVLYIDPLHSVFSSHSQTNSSRNPLVADLATAQARIVCGPLLHTLSSSVSTEC